MASQDIHVYLDSNAITPIVHAVQNDTGRRLIMHIADKSISGASSAILYFVRPDESHYHVTATVDDTNNTCIVAAGADNLTQALTKAGKVHCQIQITETSGATSSHTFIIDVERSAATVTVQQLGFTIEDLRQMAQNISVADTNIQGYITQIQNMINNGVIFTYGDYAPNKSYLRDLTGYKFYLVSADRTYYDFSDGGGVLVNIPLSTGNTRQILFKEDEVYYRRQVGGTWHPFVAVVSNNSTLTGLYRIGFKDRGTLPNNTDLNSLTSLAHDGNVYYLYGTNNTYLNAPTTGNGILIVSKATSIMQGATSTQQTFIADNAIYRRLFGAKVYGQWGPWVDIIASSDAVKAAIQNSGGQPVPVSRASEMTDQTKTYLYVGTEEGYNYGHWYFYSTENRRWIDSGQYAIGLAGSYSDLSEKPKINGNTLEGDKTGPQLGLVNSAAFTTLQQRVESEIEAIHAYYQATGDGEDVTVEAGTITQIPLGAEDALSFGDTFSISDGGIKVSEAGLYKVTGSVYMATSSDTTRQGVYIKGGPDFANAEELVSMYFPTGQVSAYGAVGAPTKVVELDANDIVYLCARQTGGTGTVTSNNPATYLYIEKMGAGFTQSEVAIAELTDIRTGHDGTVYTSAGEAVRLQIEQAMESGGSAGGGQPVVVRLAERMTDHDTIYVYVGEETGYTYGHWYYYDQNNDTWVDSGQYGIGATGNDGYSPVVTVTNTETGVDINVANKDGVATASVQNGTATDAQVAAWLDEHPEATTTVLDNTITLSKLGNDVITTVEEPSYDFEMIINLRDYSTLKKGKYEDNVFVEDEEGTVYTTGYISKEEFYSRGYMLINSETTRTPYVRFYDENKNYISGKYTKMFSTSSAFPTNAEFFVLDGSSGTYYGQVYAFYGTKIKTDVFSPVLPSVFNKYRIEEKTIIVELDANSNPNPSSINILPGETYTVSTSGYVLGYIYNEAGRALKYGLIDGVTSDNKNYGNIGGNNRSAYTYTAPEANTYIEFAGNANASLTITGPFVVEDTTIPELELVPDNFNETVFDTIAEGLGISSGKDINETFYNCTKYNVLPANADNTSALNALITLVSNNGGGVIWIPNGTYNFVKDSSTSAMGGNAQNNVYLKSNVSIQGESLNSTILKLSGATQTGCSLFGYFVQDNSNVPLVGCTFSNFTVDMSEETMATYTHKGKAFYVSGIKDCVFRDLRLLSTPSTSLGIDMLDNVVIDSVYVYQGGRQWSSGGNGGAGIGIGTGKWSHENYIIRNCICDSCGHFGIFLEDQGIFGTSKTKNYSKGQIISNNVVRNGRNYGIGLRGGRYVSITGNNVYSNSVGGVYLDYGADQSLISNNLIADTVNAVCFGNENGQSTYACTKISVINNVFSGCTNSVVETQEPSDCVVQNNVSM